MYRATFVAPMIASLAAPSARQHGSGRDGATIPSMDVRRFARRVLRSWRGLLGILALAAPPAPAGAQPVGSEFQVNTYTAGYQLTEHSGGQSVAADASGNFVVVWFSQFQDEDGFGIFGQRYDSSGVAQGNEFQVNLFTTDSQLYPSVASDASGNFVVVWESASQDGSLNGVFGQRYDSGGAAQGVEFRVNSFTTNHQRFASVASDASGNLVVVWNSYTQDGSGYGIFGQRYDSAGVAQGGEFRANSFTTNHQRFPSVASDAGGNFVVVWNSYTQDGSDDGIFGQRYESSGVAQGGEFRVNSYTTGYQRYPSVASDASGNFVVVWVGAGQDGSGTGIFGQRYDSGGAPQGSEFRVNSFTTNHQRLPSVASDASGNFVVVWNSYPQDGSEWGVFGQRYDSAGVAQGDEFQINSYTTEAQLRPSVAAMGTTQFVVAWDSFYQDGSGWGVFGQRFDFAATATIHAGDLDGRVRNAGANWRAQVKTLVHDNGHSPVPGARVTLSVSGVGTRICTTTAAGDCEVSVLVSDSVPSLTFTVTNLNKDGFGYDVLANHDPDGDSNGTTIVVIQP